MKKKWKKKAIIHKYMKVNCYLFVVFNMSIKSTSIVRIPLAGLRRPVNRSFLLVGRITISSKACLAFSRPAAITQSVMSFKNLKKKIFYKEKVCKIRVKYKDNNVL